MANFIGLEVAAADSADSALATIENALRRLQESATIESEDRRLPVSDTTIENILRELKKLGQDLIERLRDECVSILYNLRLPPILALEETFNVLIKAIESVSGSFLSSVEPRILVVGDSWAQFIINGNENGPFQEALRRCGLPGGLVTGLGEEGRAELDITNPTRTAWSATTANQWLHGEKDIQPLIEKIPMALAKYKKVSIVHLSIGGNDLLFMNAFKSVFNAQRVYDKVTLTRSLNEFDGRPLDEIAENVIKIIQLIREYGRGLNRPIKIVVCGYTQLFLNKRALCDWIKINAMWLSTLVQRIQSLIWAKYGPSSDDVKFVDNMFPSSYDKNRFRTQKLEYASFFKLYDTLLSLESPGMSADMSVHIKNKPSLKPEVEAGYRMKFEAKFKTKFTSNRSDCVYGGNVIDYYALEEMKYERDAYFDATRRNLIEDGFHLESDGYRYLAQKCIDLHYKRWLSVEDAWSDGLTSQ